MKHVVILCGGRSAEHEVSLRSAASILGTLSSRTYRRSVIGIAKDGATWAADTTASKLAPAAHPGVSFLGGKHWLVLLLELEPPPDIVFPVLHGPYGEDGTVQGALEVLGLPYVGAGVWGSAVGMDKIHSKIILQQAGLPVLPYAAVDRYQWQTDAEAVVRRAEGGLAYPLFVKPANLGSSVGINKSKDRRQLEAHLEIAFRYDDYVLIEQGVAAREIEVSVLGDFQARASVAGEIIPTDEFYTYHAKYHDSNSRLLVPAPLSTEQMEEVRALAVKTFLALQLEGMARVDFLLDKQTGRFWINEPNTIPGFTSISMYPKLWEASGLPYSELLDELVALGLARHRRRSGLSVDR
jgi:D-alanine-D-alanine ligase